MDRDDDLRAACFLALDALRAKLGDDLPYRGGLDAGFDHRGRRVPFLNYQKGIFRAAAQRGRAALSITTSYDSPYDDETIDSGFLYAYRAGPVDQSDNRALREAHGYDVPLVYFIGVRPGWYRALYPVWIEEDRPAERMVLASPGLVDAHGPERIAVHLEELPRRYVTREVRQRVHQARFRGIVLPAYADQCAICRLKEIRLLDAAHITPDSQGTGLASVRNGLSLCSIHHRAYDEQLVGVDPDYVVRVAPRLLEDEDGPMLELLKRFEGSAIQLPRARTAWPDRARLAVRHEAFLQA